MIRMFRYAVIVPVVFLLYGAVLRGQTPEYESTFISYSSKGPDGQWIEWTDWTTNKTYFDIDPDEEFITVYNDDFADVYLILSLEELVDDEGDLQTVYDCIDENFAGVTINLVKRLSLAGKRTEIYIDDGDESVAYIVVPALK